VKGLERFKAHFSDHSDQYVLIGGAACEIVLGEAGLAFRGTRDLDIVLCVEAMDADFGRALWAFIAEGGYEQRQRSTGEKEFYRFVKPRHEAYPFMLELFSRPPQKISLPADAVLTPLPIDEDVASLSAILLDERYYQFLMQTRRAVDGASVLDEAGLIPFKARAWLDLTARAVAGHQVDARNIQKHRADVFRLLQLFAPERRVVLPEAVRADMRAFLTAAAADADFRPPFGTRAEGVARLRTAFEIPVSDA